MENAIVLKQPNIKPRRENVYSLPAAQRVIVKHAGKMLFLPLDEILWIEANGEKTRFYSAADYYTVNEGISIVERRLSPRQFVRIHKSSMVNLSYIREVYSWFRGDYKVRLVDGRELNCSRQYKQKLDRVIEDLAANGDDI